MKKIKRKLLTAMLYTICWRNVDNHVSLRHYDSNNIELRRRKMYSNKDKLYLQTNDMPILREKLKKAKELTKELDIVLNDIDTYNLEFEIKKEET